MSRSEAELTGTLCKIWREMGAEVLKLHGHPMQESGWPDVFLADTLWHGFIEFKGLKTPLSKLQTAKMVRLGSLCPVFLVRFLDDLRKVGVMKFPNFEDVSEVVAVKNSEMAANLLRELRGWHERRNFAR